MNDVQIAICEAFSMSPACQRGRCYKRMKIYSPFEGGWRPSADGRQGDVLSACLKPPGARMRTPPLFLRGIFWGAAHASVAC